jgi:hypothetical protein
MNCYVLSNPFIEMLTRLKVISFDYDYLGFVNVFYRKF